MQTWLKAKRVGFCLSDKKRKKLNLLVFAELCRTRGIEVVQIDLTRSIEEQGPFDLIVHKLSDLMRDATQNDTQSQQLVQKFQDYVEAHPQIILLDPLPAMRRLSDRFQSYKLIQELQAQDKGRWFCNPPYLELATANQSEILLQIKEQNLTFPLICKTRVAQGSSSHDMALIFNEDGLRDVTPPCVLQSFINHNAILYKIFVIGQSYFVAKRPSLRNFAVGQSDQKTIFFNSHEVSKPESCSHLTERGEGDRLPSGPSDRIIQFISQGLQAALGLSLFGVDVIVDNKTSKLALIDINAFPGYEGVPEFFSALLNHMEALLRERERDPQGRGLLANRPGAGRWCRDLPEAWSPAPISNRANGLGSEGWEPEEAPMGKRASESGCFQDFSLPPAGLCQSTCE
ncbi:inositol-tetrakisphosphate 1-kinase-like isoform X1 [Chiloscyllium plagiosum]|uniref:inositol-tetrakisphosphate 1-kinase-like isoform X1 n=2 Tax=Chiloscyllium plagiosum TaxID=36176 RepID=UPI001CB84962|nr:inositol-tetrakisphosphate 1-kinase-like isoform X1 [Chiloscyllium plagiosum]